MKLEDIMLSKRSQSQKDKYGVIPLVWSIYCSQNRTNRKQKGGCPAVGEGDCRLMGVSVSAVRWKELETCCTTMWICVTLLTSRFTWLMINLGLRAFTTIKKKKSSCHMELFWASMQMMKHLARCLPYIEHSTMCAVKNSPCYTPDIKSYRVLCFFS